MTHGTKFLDTSKCKCGRNDKTDRPYGHKTKGRALFLEGYCHSCNGNKSLPYTKQQLDTEGDGIKKVFKNVWSRAIKPLGENVGRNHPLAILSSAMQAGRVVSWKRVKIGELTNGGSLYLYKK